MLNAAELADMQATQLTTMVDTCTILTKTAVPNGAGGQTVTWVPSAPIPCRLAAPTRVERELIVADRDASQLALVVTLPVGTVVTATSRVDVAGGPTLEVVSVPYRSFQTAIRALCMEVA